MVIFIKHIDIEGPDSLDDFFKNVGIETQIIELQNGDALPENINDIDAVISLGGPMSVYDEDKYPFLKTEDLFIKEVISKGVPFLGICLGSQLLAKACGARVGKSPEQEIGFLPIQVKPAGFEDGLFAGVSEDVDVFHWHGDMSELPSGAKLLASSEGCPHQAFRVGANAYGLQFHVEVTEPTIMKWAEQYLPENNAFQVKQKQKITEDYQSKKKEFHEQADAITGNFLKIINKYKNEKTNV